MDISTVWLLPLVFLILFQFTVYSFYFNFFSSLSATVVLLYFLIVQHINIPTERLITYFLCKGLDNKSFSLLERETNKTVALNAFDDNLTRKLRELIGHIVRDFILEWYNAVSNDVHFVQEAFELFEHLFTEVRKRISAVDSQILLHIILNKLIRHLHDYKQAVVSAEATKTMDSTRRQQLIVINYIKLHGHVVMENNPDTEMDHIRSLTLLLLKSLLPRDYRLTGASLYLVRELISRNVLLSLIDMLSEPDWVNSMLVRILDDDEITNSDSNDDSESNSVTAFDTDDTSENSEDKEIVSVEIPVNGVEHIQSLPGNTHSSAENVQISFSVVENMDDLNLDVSYQSQSNNKPQDSLVTEQRSFYPTDNLCVDDLLQTTSFESSTNSSPSRSSGHELTVNSSSTHSTPIAGDDAAMNSTSDLDLTPSHKYYAHHASIGSMEPSPLAHSIRNFAARRSSLQRNRFFQRIRIPEATTTEEAFEGGSKYTLYKVEYCAPSPPPPKKRSKTPFMKSTANDVAQEPEFSERSENDLYHYQVQRRFREFLTLQDRLNLNHVHRRLIRDVKGPSRMFPMPIGNMDRDYIEKRRKFLQAYLRELCSFPHINQSEEMKEFLAYSSDPRIAFVRRPSDIIPRFDKMLKNVVQEFLVSASEKLSDKFSGDEDTFQPVAPKVEKYKTQKPRFVSPFNSKSMPVVIPKQSAIESSASSVLPSSTQKLALSKSSMLNPVTKLKHIVLGRTTNVSLFEEGLRDYAPFEGPTNANDMTFGRKWRIPVNLLNNRTRFHSRSNIKRRRTQGDGCDHLHQSEEPDDDGFNDDSITGQIFCLVQLIWNVNTGVNSLLYITLARYVKNYIGAKVTALTQQDQWLRYLKNLQHALWPGGVWGGKASNDLPETKDHLKEAQAALEEAFPDALRYVTGNQHYETGVSELLESFQNPVINRHLVYHLLDVLVELLFPDLRVVSTQTSNISL